MSVTDGLDGVLRVLTMLRGRGYRVQDLDITVRDEIVGSRIRCTIALPSRSTNLLVERLRRLPVVVSAEYG